MTSAEDRRDPPALSRVSVVIPFIADRSMLERCLASIAGDEAIDEVVIVDNNSGETDLTSTWRGAPPIQVIENTSNAGFARAVDQGIAASTGGSVLVLNADAVLHARYLEECLEVLTSDARIAGVTGKLMKLDRPDVIDTTGHEVFGDRRARDRGEWLRAEGNFTDPGEVFSIPATAALYRREALSEALQLDGEVFDGDFFAYGEDVDLCWRLRLRGWRFAYTPTATGLHARSVSSGRRSSTVIAWDLRNRYLRVVKNDSAASVLRDLWQIALTEVRLTILYLLTQPVALVKAWFGFWRLLPGAIRKRRVVRSHRTVPDAAIRRWFLTYDYLAVMKRRRSMVRSVR